MMDFAGCLLVGSQATWVDFLLNIYDNHGMQALNADLYEIRCLQGFVVE